MPLAPPGTKVLIHKKPKVHLPWDFHGVEGWDIGPAAHHYLFYKVHAPKTQHGRVDDNMEFFPKKVNMPKTSLANKTTYGALNLIDALTNLMPATPFVQLGV
eukprot:4979339-Ditylum_brightwellii.AAC.1